jgi:hypothetical protein
MVLAYYLVVAIRLRMSARIFLHKVEEMRPGIDPEAPARVLLVVVFPT